MFDQIKLNYSFDALEPVIDTATMETHYGKHHAAYTKAFNELAAECGLDKKSACEILSSLDEVDDPVMRTKLRNQGGGYLNHNIYFEQLNATGKAVKAPEGKLKEAVDAAFGSMDKLIGEMNDMALSQFGSGWAWLVKDDKGKLSIIKSDNQDNPYSLNTGLTPVIAIDVWEHAYYLKYRNLRAEYLKNIWQVIDWGVAKERYEKA